MDLVAIAQTVRRHKFAALPVLILTIVLAGYVLVGAKPAYQATGAYALVNPPPPPTAAEIARNPSLGKVNANNPLVSYGNLLIVGSMLTQTMSTQAVQKTLLANGINPLSTVTVAPSSTAPVLTVTGMGSTAAEAVNSGLRLGHVLNDQLNAMQTRLGVSPAYRVTTYPLGLPNQASLKVSGKLRNLIGVLALGGILLWVSVSIAVARAERKNPNAPLGRAPDAGAFQGAHMLEVNAPGELGGEGSGNGSGIPGSSVLLVRERGTLARSWKAGPKATTHNEDLD